MSPTPEQITKTTEQLLEQYTISALAIIADASNLEDAKTDSIETNEYCYILKLPEEEKENYSFEYFGVVWLGEFTRLLTKKILSNLTHLFLSDNKLTNLPPEFAQFQNLVSLDLSDNQLSTLPPEIAQLQNLASLDLSRNKLSSVPPEIAQLQNLASLDLSRNKLSRVPPEIAQFKNLTSLILSDNQLTSLPPEIVQLQTLASLNLSHNKLSRVPSEIAQFKNLTSLDLSDNQLTSLPPEIARLQNLASLDLSRNKLSRVPPEVAQFKNLTKLNLSFNQLIVVLPKFVQPQKLEELSLRGNHLTSVPSEIAQFKNLTKLDFGFNQLTGLPPEIAQLQNLTSLDLGFNQLTNLPSEITKLQNLSELIIWKNQLTSLPPEFTELRRLTFLEVSDNRLSGLPPGFEKLQNLTSFYIGGNQLINLPSEIVHLQNLISLSVSDNQLTKLPTEFEKLRNLKELYLSNNQINSLPPEITQLKNLTLLYITDNGLNTLPPEIAQLQNLEELYLSNNQLNSLVPEIAKLHKIKKISLRGNPLEIAIPAKWLQEDTVISWEGVKYAQDIFTYYKQMHEEGGRPLGEARVLVVGEANAGKTKLIRGLLFGEYGEKFKESRTPTDGIEVTLNKDEGISLRFWDFGGQEMMHSTHTFFLSQRCVYILLADSTENPDQIEEKIESWLERIQVYGKNSPVILAASKMEDMPFSINERRLKDKYPNLVLPEAIRTSTKTGRGIEDLRRVIIEQAKKLPTLNVPLPRSFLAVKDELERMKSDEKVKTIEEADYRRVCQANGVDEEERQNTLLQLLHDMGVVFHYEDPRLNHFAIFNPNWATGAVYKVITSLQVNDSHGRFSLEGLKEILKDEDMYPASMHPRIVDLMQFFELIYELHGKRDHYILPSSLNKEQPILKEWDVPAMKFEYHYKPALLISVLHRFIVARHDYVDERFLWYSGVALNYKDNRVLIQADTRAKCIIIKIIGEEKTRKELLYAIRMEFDRIHGEIKPEENIYPPEYPNLRLNFSHMKTMSETENEFKTVYNEKTVSINLRSLLEGFVTEEERKKDEERRRKELGIKEGEEEGFKQPRQVNNFYGPVIHGDVEGDNVSVGNQNQIAQTISNANIAPEMKETLLRLNEAIKQILPALTEAEAKKTEKHLKRLVEEVKESEPDREWYSVSIEGLIKAAENLNDLGKPVISLAGKVLKLLSPLP